MHAQVNFMYSSANMTPLTVWPLVPGASDNLEQDAPAPSGDDNEDGDGMGVYGGTRPPILVRGIRIVCPPCSAGVFFLFFLLLAAWPTSLSSSRPFLGPNIIYYYKRYALLVTVDYAW
jgi:hypothetical protein